jgi:hypothetical protein
MPIYRYPGKTPAMLSDEGSMDPAETSDQGNKKL